MANTAPVFRDRLKQFKKDMKDIRPALISGAVCALIAAVVLIGIDRAPGEVIYCSGVAFFAGYCFGGILFIDH